MTPQEIEKEKRKYTRKIEIPIYEPVNAKPRVRDLYDEEYTNQLKVKINKAEIPVDVKEFLLSAAERHTKFNFAKIADFYAHSDLTIKQLFEDSALVIIDYNSSIRNGFISYQAEVDLDLEEYIESLSEDALLKNSTSKATQKIVFRDLF